jgi:hypothetical protein
MNILFRAYFGRVFQKTLPPKLFIGQDPDPDVFQRSDPDPVKIIRIRNIGKDDSESHFLLTFTHFFYG